MNVMRRITTLATLLLASSVHAHPGHPTLSVAHTHSAYEFDPLLGLLLIAAVGAAIALARTVRRRRAARTRR